MNKYESKSKARMWFVALLLAAFVAGCGGGDEGSTATTPTPTVPGAGTGAGPGGQGPAPVNLLSVLTNNFAILTKAGITNVPTSPIVGNIGSSPITAAAMNNVTCSEVPGTIYGVDAAYTGDGIDVTCFAGTAADKTLVDNAVLDMGTAYADAEGRTPDYNEVGAGNIGGMTLPPATYKWTTGVSILTDVTLNGGANDVWIFQIAQGITQASAARVILTGGALPKNVFWQSIGVVDIGTTAHMEGVILAKTAITLKTGASANSRLLAQTEVTLQQNAVTAP